MPVSYRINTESPKRLMVAAFSDQETTDDGKSADPRYPYAELTMLRGREDPNFMYNPSDGSLSESWTYSGEDEPTELFTHVPPQIRGAFADRDLRHHMPTMIGIAMHAMGSQGDIPMADSSLTKFSSSLSRKAASMGLAQPHPNNPDMESNNSEYDNFTVPPRRTAVNPGSTNFSAYWGYRPVSSEQVSQGRDWSRAKLREARARRGESQFADDTSESMQDWKAGATAPQSYDRSLF